jgi:hypothetical protein
MTREDQMKELYEAFLKYKGSRKAFCALNNINVYTFIYWQGRFSGKRKNNFLPIENEFPSKYDPKSSVEIEYPNGVKIKTSADLGVLRQLIGLV